MDPFVKQTAGVCLNTHSPIRARSTFTSSLSLLLFIFFSSSPFIPFLSVPLVPSCCPCHCSSCSVITCSRHSTFLRSTVVVKTEGPTSGSWSEVTGPGHAPSVHSRCLRTARQLHLCLFSSLCSFSGFCETSAGHKRSIRPK